MAYRTILLPIFIGILLGASPTFARTAPAQQMSISGVYTFPNSSVNETETPQRIPFAWSQLKRDADQICVTLTTTGLPPGAYTLWWVAFNKPQHCQAPAGLEAARCSSPDLLNVDAEPAVFGSGIGGVIGDEGVALFNACVSEHEFPADVLLGPGLTRTRHAEIHVALRYHCGAPELSNPRLLGEQISRFGGGCTAETQTPSGEANPTLLEGTCTCNDVHFAIHP